MSLKKLIVFCLVLLAYCPVHVDADDSRIEFIRDVQPLLTDRCVQCHGPDEQNRQADLRLDDFESATADRGGVRAVVPGDAERSELIRRILSVDPDMVMPPPESGRPLSEAEKQTLVQWVQQGAEWKQHWAFVPPATVTLPDAGDSTWPKNPIDLFVLSRLQQEGLQPAAPASRSAWLRRVTFDLTGLPPTIEELDSFLADDSEDAFERVVDRLLNSPRYGEHMAAMWLDAARYADTDGYQNDGPRTMFRWRDWVIDAYNDNMPFDQFTIEQLAGDLLPNATRDQKIATGFNRNHRYNSEAGLVLEEFLLENAVDRVDTTSTVWMGMTIGCARCHDHKYDPISQREYYQLLAFFDNITESGRAIKFGNSEPWIIAPTSTQQEQLDALESEIATCREELSRLTARVERALEQPSASRIVRALADRNAERQALMSRGPSHHLTFDAADSEDFTAEEGRVNFDRGVCGKSLVADGQSVIDLGKFGDVQCDKRCSVAFWLNPADTENGVVLSRQSAGSTRPGFTVELRDGYLRFFIITRWVAGVGAVESSVRIPAGAWTHVTLTNDGTQRAKGQKIWLNGRQVTTRILFNTNSNTGGTKPTAMLRFGGGLVGKNFSGQIDELQFYRRTLFEDEIRTLAEQTPIKEILDVPPGQRTNSSRAKLIAWLVGCVGREQGDKAGSSQIHTVVPLLRPLAKSWTNWHDLRQRRTSLLDSFPTSMVMEEREVKQATTVRIRGVYDNHGEVVQCGTPAIFPEFPNGEEPDRLRFARWLVSGKHPLTARVTVNRYWQQYFGHGIVRTPEDFGRQGELPTNPGLLDWLALRFVESGWNVKAMQKLIVLSATYRQHGRVRDGESRDIDPENRLLGRGPRLRLTARQLRDQALFCSGLMTPDIGGPSVFPYQPANLWEEMSNMKYRQSTGKDLFRRGIYTFWKRTVAPPALALLDAADRETCAVRQRRTNTPLLALTLLNEETLIECSRQLALRLQQVPSEHRGARAFRIVTSRHATPAERDILDAAREKYVAAFRRAPDAARALVTPGDPSLQTAEHDVTTLAADTLLCNLIFNLDAALTK